MKTKNKYDNQDPTNINPKEPEQSNARINILTQHMINNKKLIHGIFIKVLIEFNVFKKWMERYKT